MRRRRTRSPSRVPDIDLARFRAAFVSDPAAHRRLRGGSVTTTDHTLILVTATGDLDVARRLVGEAGGSWNAASIAYGSANSWSTATIAYGRTEFVDSYSHSMVPGGLLVMSSTTRLTSGTSLVMRVEMRSSTS